MNPDLNRLAKYDAFNEGAAAVANTLMGHLRRHGRKGEVTHTIGHLVNRITRSIESLTLLFRKNPKDAELDGASILRTVYDAHLQVLYILDDPEPRAKLYADFFNVEWHKFREMIDRRPEGLFKLVAKSPNRAKTEPANDANFRRVEAEYRRPDGSYRQNWYRGTPRDLARRVGYEGEFLVLSRLLNPIVHSSAFGLFSPTQMNGDGMVSLAWDVLFRCMGKTLEYEGILSKVDSEVAANVLKPTYKPVFEVDDAMLEHFRQEAFEDD
ncbi:MAG: DUF5677 domain-containing protein [Tepidisphaeraceae bacterium]